MKLTDEILKNKTSEQKKSYLEKYRTLLHNQIYEVSTSIMSLEIEIQNNNIEKIVAERMKTVTDSKKSSSKLGQISTIEYDDLMYELEHYPDLIQSIQDHFKIDSLGELSRVDLQYVKNKIRTLKKVHENRD